MTSANLETEQDRIERLARHLAAVIDRQGFARFPKAGWPNWTGDELREHRRELFDVIERRREAGRDVEVLESNDATVVRWRP